MGAKPGVQDLFLIYAGQFHGIELKTETGRLSTAQVICHADIGAAGGKVAVIRSLDQLKAQLEEWGIPLRSVSLTNERMRNAFRDFFATDRS